MHAVLSQMVTLCGRLKKKKKTFSTPWRQEGRGDTKETVVPTGGAFMDSLIRKSFYSYIHKGFGNRRHSNAEFKMPPEVQQTSRIFEESF